MPQGRRGYRLEVKVLVRGFRELEQRCLALQERIGAEGLSSERLIELTSVVREIQHLYGVLQDERGRRDLNFVTERQLARMEEWARWLVRKLVDEYLLRARVTLEQNLRAALLGKASDYYVRSAELGDVVRELSKMPDGALTEHLWQGDLALLLSEQLEPLLQSPVSSEPLQPVGTVQELVDPPGPSQS